MTINQAMNIKRWAQDMADQEASGLKQFEWCTVHNVANSTFRYRAKKVNEYVKSILSQNNQFGTTTSNGDITTLSFAKVNLPAPTSPHSCIELKTNRFSVQIYPDAPIEQVKVIMEVLSQC